MGSFFKFGSTWNDRADHFRLMEIPGRGRFVTVFCRIASCFLLPAFLVGGLHSITFSQGADPAGKFRRVLSLIENNYTDSVKSDRLADAAVVAMLEELDPHSVYIPREEMDEMTDPLEGNFDGIGIQFNLLRDSLLVVATVSGGPSEKAGILAGDRIVSVNGKPLLKGFSNQDVRTRLMGPRGTTVQVGIKRPGVSRILDFTITRDRIPILSVDAAFMVDKKAGYIRLNKFSAYTMSEFRTALTNLKNQGCKDLILDLQDNGGGFLNVAFELADEFLDGEKLIVYTQGRVSPRLDYLGGARGEFEKGRLVILVDEGSASSSEILAGAIQDWDRGVIIGRRTFGKGLVQREFGLPDGSAIRLTIARYFTPTGRCIQKPYSEGILEYDNELDQRYRHGELATPDSIRLNDSLLVRTLVHHRPVYGGGGILPDVFVPLDTSYFTEFYQDLLRTGFLNTFIVNWVDQHRTELRSNFPDLVAFSGNFSVKDDLLTLLVQEGEKEKIQPRPDQLEQSRENLGFYIKAMIARDLYGDHGYFYVMSKIDPAFQKAKEILDGKNRYQDLLEGKGSFSSVK